VATRGRLSYRGRRTGGAFHSGTSQIEWSLRQLARWNLFAVTHYEAVALQHNRIRSNWTLSNVRQADNLMQLPSSCARRMWFVMITKCTRTFGLSNFTSGCPFDWTTTPAARHVITARHRTPTNAPMAHKQQAEPK
jgi:hypothetical protein